MAQRLKFFCWTVSVIFGKTAGAADSKMADSKLFENFESARYFRIESESSKSNLKASQVPSLQIPGNVDRFEKILCSKADLGP